MLLATSFIGMALVLLSCTGITIKDSEWYGSKGMRGAVGFHTLSEGQENLDYPSWVKKWFDLKHPIICTSTDTFSDWKAVIEKQCSFNNNCSYMTPEQQKALQGFFQKVDQVKSK